MRRRTPTRAVGLGVALLSCLSGCAASLPSTKAPGAHVVPLQRVRLYETGVGYFERQGDGRGSTLPVPASHLDDALKTLVLLGKGGAPVRAVSFPSSVSGARARARMGLPTGTDPVRYRDLLASLKGERVKLTTTRDTRTGTLVDVVDEHVAVAPKVVDGKEGKPEKVEITWVLFLGDGGELSRERLDDLSEVRPLDPAFAARLETALASLSPRHALLRRDLSVLGDDEGPLSFGYIAETPVWRASYRVVLDESAHKAMLQGWALVHNDTDEDWKGVHLEIASGQPDSFLFPLAAPRYRHRPIQGPDADLSTLPQLGEATADALWGELGSTSSGHGFGSGHGSMSGSHSVRAPQVRMGRSSVAEGTREDASDLLSVGNLREVARSSAEEELAQSVFKPEGLFSLGAQRSALVPIVSRQITAEPLVLFTSEGQAGRTAMRLTNTTASALPAGTVAVFGQGGLVGEAMLDRLPAREARLITLGNEVDVEVKLETSESTEETKKVVWKRTEGLSEHFLRTTVRHLEVENRGGSERAIWLGLSVADNSKVSGAERVVADTTVSTPHAVLLAPPVTKKKRALTIVEGLSRTTAPRSVDERRVRELSKKAGLSPTEQSTLVEAAGILAEESKVQDRIALATRDKKEAEADLERFREHLKATGDKATSAAPFVKKIIDAEARLEAAQRLLRKLEQDSSDTHHRALAALEKLR